MIFVIKMEIAMGMAPTVMSRMSDEETVIATSPLEDKFAKFNSLANLNDEPEGETEVLDRRLDKSRIIF
jgi:hypothetical protein